MTWIVRNPAHGVEHRHQQLGTCLIALKIDRCHRDTLTGSAGVSRTKMIEREREDILLALLTAAKRRIARRAPARAELIVHILDRALEQILHTASGRAARCDTMAPVNVEPVVPVSSTMR